MKRKNVLITSILALTVLASSSAMAFAATDATTSATSTAKGSDHDGGTRAELNLTDAQRTLLHESRSSDMKEALANLVRVGTFTQAEADSIISNIPAEPADKDAGPFQNLTETQKAALQAKLETLRPATEDKTSGTHTDREAIMTKAVAALVTDGVLTQSEADKLISGMPTKSADREKGPFQNLTEKQRTALQSELKTLGTSSIKGLVSDGTITQAQADLMAKRGMDRMDGPEKEHGERP